jgi:FtsP/CotA-like multicopper oxidase with cupredoxin domain
MSGASNLDWSDGCAMLASGLPSMYGDYYRDPRRWIRHRIQTCRRDDGIELQASFAMACNFFNFLTGLLSLSSSLSSYLPDCVQSDHVTRNAVRFEIHLTAGKANPTGAGFRDVILVNGTFTGPTLHLERGDNVEFLVRNYLREDTALHFHGITQSISPWADGTPGIAQKPIRPGASYLYKWQADESGVFFYHAHSRGQLMDGMYGAIVINPGDDEANPFHMMSRNSKDWLQMREAEKKMQTLMISDWSQYSFKQFMNVEKAANIDYTCMDAIIVNGAVSPRNTSLNRLGQTLTLAPGLRVLSGTGLTERVYQPACQVHPQPYRRERDH